MFQSRYRLIKLHPGRSEGGLSRQEGSVSRQNDKVNRLKRDVFFVSAQGEGSCIPSRSSLNTHTHWGNPWQHRHASLRATTPVSFISPVRRRFDKHLTTSKLRTHERGRWPYTYASTRHRYTHINTYIHTPIYTYNMKNKPKTKQAQPYPQRTYNT